MSGFVAIIADDPRAEVPEEAIADFAEAYVALRGGRTDLRADAGPRARICVFDGPDPASEPLQRRGDSWIAVGGVAHHPAPLLDARVDDLEGQFAVLRHDADTGALTLASDPVGMFGLFVGRRDGRTYASTSVLALARHLRTPPDVLGLRTFLLAGYHCGSRTSWEGLERIAGGTAIEWQPDGPRRRTYWRPEIDPAIRRLPIGAAVDRCVGPAVAGVRLAGADRQPVWSDLTGGYDSRLLSLLTRAAGLDFAVSTSGKPEEEDVQLAQLISRRAGWDWTLLELPDDWGDRAVDAVTEAVGWGDSALDVLQLATVQERHRAKATRFRRLLNGGGGEHYWSYAWQHEYGRSRRSGRGNVDAWVRIRMLRPVPSEVFARDPRPEVVADLKARMGAVIEPYRDEPRATQADLLYAHKSTGHFGAYAAAGGAHLDVMLPFYTRDSFTTALSVDPRHRFGHRFYSRLIERMDPRIAALPTAKGGPAQPVRLTNFHRFTPYYLRLGEKGFNKVVGRVLGRSFRKPAGAGDPRLAAGRSAVVAHVGTDVGAWRSGRLYDRDQLTQLLADASRPELKASVLLGRILTVELSLRAADATVDGR